VFQHFAGSRIRRSYAHDALPAVINRTQGQDVAPSEQSHENAKKAGGNGGIRKDLVPRDIWYSHHTTQLQIDSIKITLTWQIVGW
jgi:hypothetical protein